MRERGRPACKTTRIVYCQCDAIARLVDAMKLLHLAMADIKTANRIAEGTDGQTPVPSK